MNKSIAIVVVVWELVLSAGVNQTVLAQAGSVGGTIGKTDKSASGGERSEPAQSSSKPEPRKHGVVRSQDVAVNLTGKWSCDDGGTYTVRQSGSKISWEGVSGDGGKSWTHTFNGVIRDNVIDGGFFDHPPGANRQAGALKIRIVAANRLEKLEQGTWFGGSVWTRAALSRP